MYLQLKYVIHKVDIFVAAYINSFKPKMTCGAEYLCTISLWLAEALYK